ncbi:hypothetical protein K7X08_013759 [Anisodus acutangulus]|uniref:Uncharacterized protein n=1 Tax=Anisodus acutangulus TaxID=402998 RepID=A0A9Q1LKV7_9SOLA|nr:hypothetical protein K7X08_013759 [Anisodus acutangulus]
MSSGKIQEAFQEFACDNLPLYCNHCKHQGHDESCRLILKKNQDDNHKDDRVAKEEQCNVDKFQDAKNNEIEIKKAIKNNGDRVVDTCVRDDTLNTTVIVNRVLARVSQDLILGAKVGATSDLVDLVINLKTDQAFKPNQLPITAVLNAEDSGQANKVQQREENLD